MQMNIYTNIRTNLTTWDTEDAGYAIDGSAFSTNASNWFSAYPYNSLLIFYLSCVVLSFVLACVFTIVVILKVLNKHPMNSESDESKAWKSFLWTSVGTLLQFNVLLLLIDVVQVGIWCVSTGCGTAALLKVTWMIFTVSFSVLFWFFFLHFKSTPGVPSLEAEKDQLQLLCPPLLSHPCFLGFHFCCTSKAATIIFRIFFFPTVLVFSSILFHYSLPVLLLFVAYPIKVAALYSFLIAVLVLYILIAFYGEYKRVLLPDFKKWNAAYSFYYLCLPLLNIILIIVILSLFVSVYYVVSVGFHENSVFSAIVSFLPSLLLSFLIWFIRKRFQGLLQGAHSDVATTSQRDRQQEQSEQEDSMDMPSKRGLKVGLTEL